MKKIAIALIILSLISIMFSSCMINTKSSIRSDDNLSSSNEKILLFSDNNSKFDYTNYKKMTCETYTYKISFSYPSSWNEYCIPVSEEFDWQQVGVQLVDGQMPEQLEIVDGNFFISECSNGFISTSEYINFDTEYFTTANGYKIEIYYNKDKLPKFITFTDYPSLCIFLDINEYQIDEIVNIVNSIKIEPITEQDTTENVETTTYESQKVIPINTEFFKDIKPIVDNLKSVTYEDDECLISCNIPEEWDYGYHTNPDYPECGLELYNDDECLITVTRQKYSSLSFDKDNYNKSKLIINDKKYIL